MNKIKHIEQITNKELKELTSFTASWHQDYADSAYIFLGGLNYRMNEGDLVIVCSQFGEVVDCRLARDKKTGKSRGFAFLAYEDQRSTVLAVDNLNGIELCGRTILCDHVKQYKIPKEMMFLSDAESGSSSDAELPEEEREAKREEKAKERWEKKLYKPTGPDQQGWGDFRKVTEQESVILEELLRIEKKEEQRKEKLQLMEKMKDTKLTSEKPAGSDAKPEPNLALMDENERWEYMLRQQQEREREEDKRKEQVIMKGEIAKLKKILEKEKMGLKKADKKSKKIKKDKKKKHKKSRHSDSD